MTSPSLVSLPNFLSSIRKRVRGVCAIRQRRWHPEAQRRPRCHRLLALRGNRGNHCQLPSHSGRRHTRWRLPARPCHLHPETQRGKGRTRCWSRLDCFHTFHTLFYNQLSKVTPSVQFDETQSCHWDQVQPGGVFFVYLYFIYLSRIVSNPEYRLCCYYWKVWLQSLLFLSLPCNLKQPSTLFCVIIHWFIHINFLFSVKRQYPITCLTQTGAPTVSCCHTEEEVLFCFVFNFPDWLWRELDNWQNFH